MVQKIVDSSTSRLQARQNASLIAVIVTTALLGMGSILALETVKSSYQTTIDVLLQLKSDFQTVEQKILEIRRDEIYLSDRNQGMIEIQLENIESLKHHLRSMRAAEQSIIKDTAFTFIESSLDQYLGSFKKVAQWVIQEGDWKNGQIFELEKAAESLRSSGVLKTSRAKDLFMSLDQSRVKYVTLNDQSLYDQILQGLDVLGRELANSGFASSRLLLQYRQRLQDLNELRWNISLERASFLKTMLMTEHKIQNSIIYIDNYTVEENIRLKSLVSNVTWGLFILVVLTLMGVGASASFFRYLARRIHQKSDELHDRNQDIANILNNVKLGIFTIRPDGTVHREYSQYLEEILEEQKLEGRTISSVLLEGSDLSQDKQELVKSALETSLGESILQYETNAHLLPHELQRTSKNGHTKILELQWDVMQEDDVVIKQMVTIRDVTELRQIQAESERRKLELNMLMDIIVQPIPKLQSFFKRNEDLLTQAVACCNDTEGQFDNSDDDVRRYLHTLKGNARTMKLDILANAVHVAEDRLKAHPDKTSTRQSLASVKAIFFQYLQIFNDRVLAYNGLKTEGSVDPGWLTEQLRKAMMSRHPQETLESMYVYLKKIQGLTMQAVIRKSYEIVPKLSRDEGKVSSALKEKVENITLTEKGAALLQNILTHLFANAVAHGFETEEERRQAKKHPQAVIQVEASLQDEQIQMKFSDDGRGLHMAKVREIAASQYPQRSFSSPQDYAQLIFEAGISTEAKAGVLAGRGVGMSAVKSFLEDVHGRIEISLGQGADDRDFVPIQFDIFIPRIPSLVDECIPPVLIPRRAN